jgi:hypothetical protein
MTMFSNKIWLFSLGLFISVGMLSGCGDQVQDVSVSVKTAAKDGSPLRYVQFTLNERGMITNKDGVKKTTLKLKSGDLIKFNLVRLPNGFVLDDPAQRGSWNAAFNGDAAQPVMFNVILKPEGEVVAAVDTPVDAGVELVETIDAGVEAPVEASKVRRPRKGERRPQRSGRRPAQNVQPADEPQQNAIAVRPRQRRPEPEPFEDGTMDLPPLPSEPEVRDEPEPIARVERREEIDDDPLAGLEGIDDDPIAPPVGVNGFQEESNVADILEPLPIAEVKSDNPIAAVPDLDEDLPDDLILEEAGVGGTTDAATLIRLREKLDNGGALSAGEIGDLESTPKIPKREFVESRRLLADWYYQNRQWRKQAGALKIATETRGPYRRDPMVLLSLAKAYGHLKSYRQASKVMANVERYGNRLPKEKRADAYRFHAEMLEFQFLQQQRDDPEKANLELINQAMSKLRKLITFVGGASPQAKRFAEERLGKLEELKRRVAE